MNVAEPAHILVVDDEPDLRELVTDVLERDGLDVASAANGAQACALAERRRPDLVVADIRLPDCTGLEIVDKLRARVGDVPTVVITGTGDVRWASEACRRGCVDFLTKPLDLPRLCGAIRRELSRRRQAERTVRRSRKLRRLARELSHRHRNGDERLTSTCAALTTAYRTLSRQLNRQDTLLRFQRQLMGCRNDDDIFRQLFDYFCGQGENLFGVALACDENAELKMLGRFGTPGPDSVSICQGIAFSLLDVVLENPTVMRVDPVTHVGLFPQWLHQHLADTRFLLLPLLPEEGQLIGVAILYRKAGQPFTENEEGVGQMLAPSIAMSLQGNSRHLDEE